MKQRLTPWVINKKFKTACKSLDINKPITCYSLKRNGVMMKRLLGYTDAEIQHTARWTSTKQLHTYDLSDQDDVFKIQLAKRGLIKNDNFKEFQPQTKACVYCSSINGVTDKICIKCKRPLDREEIKKDIFVNPRERDEKDNKVAMLLKELYEADPKLLEKTAKRVGLIN